ncbi:hypothetical protein DOY81_010880, partial [Sarcophaga bullata]
LKTYLSSLDKASECLDASTKSLNKLSLTVFWVVVLTAGARLFSLVLIWHRPNPIDCRANSIVEDINRVPDYLGPINRTAATIRLNAAYDKYNSDVATNENELLATWPGEARRAVQAYYDSMVGCCYLVGSVLASYTTP